MAVQTIGFADKQFLNQNSDIADVNKVNDTDINEIKGVTNNNANEVQEIENYFNLNIIENITTGTISGGGTLSNVDVAISKNQNGSLAKIYGQIDVATNGHNGNVTIATSLSPSTQLTILGTMYRQISFNGFVRNTSLQSMTLNTDGTLVFSYINTGLGTNENYRMTIIGTLLFIKDFGDSPIE